MKLFNDEKSKNNFKADISATPSFNVVEPIIDLSPSIIQRDDNLLFKFCCCFLI